MPDTPRAGHLAPFFDRLVRWSLADLALGGDVAAPYLSRLLTRFVRTDQLYALRDAAGRRLESVVELLVEAERSWAFDAPDFNPFREREVRQHIGDFTLFMSGIFPEHVARRASAALYVREGKRAYQVVADFERSALRPDARLFAALAAGFEQYAAALLYMKRVYLRAADAPAGVRSPLSLLTGLD